MLGALMLIMRENVVGSWEFVLVLLLNVDVYIQSHASAVIDLCIDNHTGSILRRHRPAFSERDIRAVLPRVGA